jgi:predicted metalloendopeptidase
MYLNSVQVARLRSDPHSPNNFRVDGTLFNIPEFARAFDCPKNARVCLISPFYVLLLSTYLSFIS